MSDPRPLIVEPDAEAELAEGMTWYEERQPGLGAALLGEVAESIDVTTAGTTSPALQR